MPASMPAKGGETRLFHLGDILTITTGRLVSPRHMDGVYDILNFMTGDNLFTHQLPRACDECAGPLLAQHPDLAAVDVPENFGGKEDADAWLTRQVARFGEMRTVTPLHEDDHTRIGPLMELSRIAPQAEVIAVILPDD
jgi:hypothetical protein